MTMSIDTVKYAELISAYKSTFLTENGRHVLDDLAVQGMLDRTTFDPDPTVMSYNNGKRDILIHIMGMLHESITDYLMQNTIREEF